MGGVRSTVTKGINKKGQETNYINGKSLDNWVRSFEKNYDNPTAMLESLISSIDNPDDRRRMQNLLFMRGDQGNFLYQGSTYDAYRQKIKPSMYAVPLTAAEKKAGMTSS